nr:hypothetical protein [Nocardioides houyundeii]
MQLGVDLGRLALAAGLQLGETLLVTRELLAQPLQARLGPLGLLHDVELGVLQAAHPALQRLQLVGHPLQVLGVGDQPTVHAVPVAGAPRPRLLHVRLGLGLLDAEVVDHDLGVADLVEDGVAADAEGVDLSGLGQVGAPVTELVHSCVDLLEVQKSALGGGVGFQRVLLQRWVVRPGMSRGPCRWC